jgi:hypothetical protein
MGATGVCAGWKVQVCGPTWCMLGWAIAIFDSYPL